MRALAERRTTQRLVADQLGLTVRLSFRWRESRRSSSQVWTYSSMFE
jgi:hypothetical protein